MAPTTATLPEDPFKPGRDVLGSKLGNRGHFVGTAMWLEAKPMHPSEIGERARPLAEAHGGRVKPTTYSTEVTRNHLRWMEERGYAEQTRDGLWRLTDLARKRIENVSTGLVPTDPDPNDAEKPTPVEVVPVDGRGRVQLPKPFVDCTVTIQMVSPTELRIRKAVVLPEDDLPLMEDALVPLSDRDRDLFLNLLDNPPEPTPAFRAEAAKYKKRHAR